MDDGVKDVRLPVMVTRAEAEAIDAWRYNNWIPSRAEAIRQLIRLGLVPNAMKSFTTRLDGEILLVAQRISAAERRSVTTVVEMAVLAYAKSRGYDEGSAEVS